MRKLSVNRGVWYIGGRKKRRQRGGFFLFAVLAAPILGNFATPILKEIIRGGRKINIDIVDMVRDNPKNK